MMQNTNIACMMIRGGTSKGAYFLADDLPTEEYQRNEFLIDVMGSGDNQQINGIGGGTTLTSKVAIVSKSPELNIDLEYLFAQVGIADKVVDTKPSCGNILSGIVAFAAENQLITFTHPSTTIRVRNTNTDTIIEVSAQTPDGQLQYEGNTTIDGVPGSGSPILLNFLDVGGAKTGKLFPTGQVRNHIQGVDVTCIDAAVPMVHIMAKDLGIKGNESKIQLDDNTKLLADIEQIRIIAGGLMGLENVKDSVLPKVSLVSASTQEGHLTSRYFVPSNCHASHAVTGAICVAAASTIAGTVAYEVANKVESDTVIIEHPCGRIQVNIQIEEGVSEPIIRQAALVRTARPLFKGYVYSGV